MLFAVSLESGEAMESTLRKWFGGLGGRILTRRLRVFGGNVGRLGKLMMFWEIKRRKLEIMKIMTKNKKSNSTIKKKY